MTPRLFYLIRDRDVVGVSGTGCVADGVVWQSGKVSMHWRGQHGSITVYDNLDSAIAVHCHGSASRIVFPDWLEGGIGESRIPDTLDQLKARHLDHAQDYAENIPPGTGYESTPASCEWPWLRMAWDRIDELEEASKKAGGATAG